MTLDVCTVAAASERVAMPHEYNVGHFFLSFYLFAINEINSIFKHFH